MDLNGDGIDDVVTGEYTPGNVYWFEGSKSGLKERRVIPESDAGTAAADPNDMRRWMSTARFVDFDGDHDFDMIVGNVKGEVFLNRNEGTAQQFQFGKRVPLMEGSKPVKVQQKSDPWPVDWDGDGILDLLVGDECAGVTYFKGKGDGTFEEGRSVFSGNKIPLEGGFEVISKRMGEDSGVPGYRLRVATTDWNQDGKLDLLVGNCEQVDGETIGNVYLFLREE